VNKQLGSFGEAWAAGYLRRLGYQIVARNVRYRVGEIDIVAWDGEELVFVEVKCRRTSRFGTPLESITSSRYARLSRAAETYLQGLPETPRSYRIDVVAVEVGASGAVDRTQLLRGIESPA
jgi:putative endonuclease